MKRFTPVYGLFIVLLFMGAILVGDYAMDRGFDRAYQRVSPDRNGEVRIDASDLEQRQVRFYRFLNAGNQEVKFFVGRDHQGTLQVAFDASDICFKKKRGFRVEAGEDGDWVICNACDKSFRLSTINAGTGGCAPTTLGHRVESDQVILSETEILAGWRLFR